MDEVLLHSEQLLFKPYIYPSVFFQEEYTVYRQALSLSIIEIFGSYSIYLISSGFAYYFLFEKELMNHPLFLKDQIRKEIQTCLTSLPLISLYQVPFFLLEVRGYSKLHNDITGVYSIVIDIIQLIAFTDFCGYWIHRLTHHKLVYKRIHKIHHFPKIPTPFASLLFHPVDGFLQSAPFHAFAFMFRLNKYVFLTMLLFGNCYAVFIHDGNFKVNKWFMMIFNGPTQHTVHHLYYNYNYGQYFTFWDRVGGTYRNQPVP